MKHAWWVEGTQCAGCEGCAEFKVWSAKFRVWSLEFEAM